ncbi:hypothetical protein BDZ97DRAFT_1666590, partial [Flammula alnicola]
LFAILWNWGLLGVLTVQVYMYFMSFPEDRLVLKTTVYGVFVLEALQTILLTSSEFKMLATNFANPAGLDQVDLIWFSVPMLSGIVATISQIFYAYRLKVITKNKYLVGSIVLLSLVQLGGAIALGVQNKEAGLFSRLFSNQSKQSFITTTVWEVSSALCDVLIAVYMTYHLRRQDTGIKQTQALLSRIIRLTVQTGTFTGTFSTYRTILLSLHFCLWYILTFHLFFSYTCYRRCRSCISPGSSDILSDCFCHTWKSICQLNVGPPKQPCEGGLISFSILGQCEVANDKTW